MATYTPNLNLKKPSTNENYDVVADLNDSKDKIDLAFGANAEKSDTNGKELLKIKMPYYAIRQKLESDAKYGTINFNYIGDSISQGYDSTDHLNNGWASIMRKFINKEFGSKNLGFVSIMATGFFHSVSVTSGIWTNEQNFNYLGGHVYSSNDSVGFLKIVPKRYAKYFKICYEQRVDGGEFDIYVNNAFKATVNTAGAADKAKSTTEIDISNINRNEKIEIEIRKKDAYVVAISGVWYYDDANKIFNNNYSRSGNKLTATPEYLLDVTLDANVVFFALGHNDSVNDIDVFKSKVDYIINKINNSDTFLVVLDFRWSFPESDLIRKQLKRLSDECNKSIYIAPADNLYDGNIVTMFNYGFFEDDYSHPSDLGHKVIAESTAKILGLSISSKNVIELLNVPDEEQWIYIGDYGNPSFKNGWENFDSANKNRAKFKKIGNIVYVEFYLSSIGAVKNSTVFTLPEGYRPNITFRQILYTYENATPELVILTAEVNASGDVKMFINTNNTPYYYGQLYFLCE